MNIQKQGKLEITCKKCKKHIDIYCFQIQFSYVNSKMRELGIEAQYLANRSLNCPQCTNKIDIECRVYEYPIDSVSHHEFYISGATVVKEPEFSMEEEV